MRDEYDFTNAKKNPYIDRLSDQITIRVSNNTIDYFKRQSERKGIPYLTLINMYLNDCAENNRELQFASNVKK